ncbi:hypothetical protein, partial [Enhygromyxa salina]|uniref:hypothetical protein n=1 Tax=Enhygromyxa salina TaxID=215803 RepID=UPI0011B1DC7E
MKQRRRVHLPVVSDPEPSPELDPHDDPLALLRGGPFARAFALFLGVLGVVWMVAHEVHAESPGPEVELVDRVHTALRATPP